MLWSTAAPLFAATPVPSPQPVPSAILKKLKALPPPAYPKIPLHAEITVDTNKLGQVTHVTNSKLTREHFFNMQVYGNALQVYIRTDTGKAVAGKYLLTYDYDPKTKRVKRQVALLQRGGVDPDATSAVTQMVRDAKSADHHARVPGKQ